MGAAILMAGTVAAFGFSIWLLKIGLMATMGYVSNMTAQIVTMQSQLERMLSYAGDMDDSKKDMFDEEDGDEGWKNGS